MMYSGIDLHSNNSVIAVIDDGDRVVAQKASAQGRLVARQRLSPVLLRVHA